jgi:hypothetical protein
LKTRGWTLNDAESTYGTFIDATKLPANKPQPVPDGARVKFGSIDMRFYLPEAFLSYVKGLITA